MAKAWRPQAKVLYFGDINSHVVHVIRAGDLISSPDANHHVDCGGGVRPYRKSIALVQPHKISGGGAPRKAIALKRGAQVLRNLGVFGQSPVIMVQELTSAQSYVANE